MAYTLLALLVSALVARCQKRGGGGMMRAYEFVLPAALNRVELEEVLAETFGGFTAWQAIGAWQDGGRIVREAVAVYRVALSWRDILLNGQGEVLFALVFGFAKQEGEKALYFGTPGRPAIYPTGN